MSRQGRSGPPSCVSPMQYVSDGSTITCSHPSVAVNVRHPSTQQERQQASQQAYQSPVSDIGQKLINTLTGWEHLCSVTSSAPAFPCAPVLAESLTECATSVGKTPTQTRTNPGLTPNYELIYSTLAASYASSDVFNYAVKKLSPLDVAVLQEVVLDSYTAVCQLDFSAAREHTHKILQRQSSRTGPPTRALGAYTMNPLSIPEPLSNPFRWVRQGTASVSTQTSLDETTSNPPSPSHASQIPEASVAPQAPKASQEEVMTPMSLTASDPLPVRRRTSRMTRNGDESSSAVLSTDVTLPAAPPMEPAEALPAKRRVSQRHL